MTRGWGVFLLLTRWQQTFPWNSPYAFSENRVIDGIELEGLEVVLVNPETEPGFYSGGMEYTENSAVHISAHGNSSGFVNRSADLSTKAEFVETKREFEAVLQKSDNYETLKETGKLVVVLHSCNVASGKNNFVQKMSKEYGATVIGPDAFLRFNSSGHIGPRVNRASAVREGVPDYKGSWMVYTQGVLTGVYDADWSPTANPSWLDNMLYSKDFSFSVDVGEGSHLNLRAGAGTSFESIGQLQKGTILNPTGNVDNGWVEVTTGCQTGWVSSEYLNAVYDGKGGKSTQKQKKDL